MKAVEEAIVLRGLEQRQEGEQKECQGSIPNTVQIFINQSGDPLIKMLFW